MICTVICYCTNDERFLDRCIREVSLFSPLILIAICDHFFDGTPEDRARLDQTYAKWPQCQFIEFAWDVKQLYTPFIEMPETEQERICLWHSTARYIATLFLPEEAEYVLFLDVDEIPEGDRLAAWFGSREYEQFEACWFYAYQYRFRASEQLPGWQYIPLLVRKQALTPLLVLNEKERFGILQSLTGRFWLKGAIDRPFFHHYSWVRSQEECLRKVRTWGKRAQLNWKERLESAWARGEFLEEGPFEQVTPFFDPLSVVLDKTERPSVQHNVIRVDRAAIFRKDLEAHV